MARARVNPRLSINQLGNYLIGTASKRRTVLNNAKNPPTFIVNWYEAARNCIVDFIVGGMADEAMLIAEMGRLRTVGFANGNEELKNRTNADAIEAVLGSYDQLDLLGLTATTGPNAQPRLSINNVEISVRPEILLRGQYRGADVAGAIKLYISKDEPLTDVSAPYIAAVVHQHAEAHHANGAATRPNTCLVYDVIRGAVHIAPTAVARRRQDIAAACEEIALVWPSIESREPFQRDADD